MNTFKEWLKVQEAQSGYGASARWGESPVRGLGMFPSTRGLGSREEEPNPLKRASADITPFPTQAIQQTSSALKTIMQQRQYPPELGIGPPHPTYGSLGYMGTPEMGVKAHHQIDSDDKALDGYDPQSKPIMAQYRALESSIHQARQENTVDNYDWSRCLISRVNFTSDKNKKIFKISMIVPWAGVQQFAKHPGFINPDELMQQVRQIDPNALDLEQLLRKYSPPKKKRKEEDEEQQ